MMIPPHKQTDPTKAPGQFKNDVTLGDYIAKRVDPPPQFKTPGEAFDLWIDEPWYELGGKWYSRRDSWTLSEVSAARVGFMAAWRMK